MKNLTEVHLQGELVCYLCNLLSSSGKAFEKLKKHLENFGLWKEKFTKNILVIQGDLNKPQLGLSSSRWERLCSEMDVIVNCGGYFFPIYVML